MKAYGVKKKDAGCCPGHDKYGGGYKMTKRKSLKRRDRPRKKSARQSGNLSLVEHGIQEIMHEEDKRIMAEMDQAFPKKGK